MQTHSTRRGTSILALFAGLSLAACGGGGGDGITDPGKAPGGLSVPSGGAWALKVSGAGSLGYDVSGKSIIVYRVLPSDSLPHIQWSLQVDEALPGGLGCIFTLIGNAPLAAGTYPLMGGNDAEPDDTPSGQVLGGYSMTAPGGPASTDWIVGVSGSVTLTRVTSDSVYGHFTMNGVETTNPFAPSRSGKPINVQGTFRSKVVRP